ncbi:hypothetical protein V9T40_011306 [Parthenolecanium corni]|uniref:SEA domain-containing protein n=1 Tax=Parthenolecanium corni TaxID=536013 RepID=A0AAN9T7N1_9HEMI
MTFRPETNPKDSASDKKGGNSNEAGNGAENTAARISTIYDPRLSSVLLAYVTVPLHTTVPAAPAMHSNVTDKKKTVVEQIKKITLKLKSKKNDDLDEIQRQRIRWLKFLCLSTVLVLSTVLFMGLLTFVLRTVHKPNNRNLIVDGEFQILNRKFELEMLDKQSPAFKELAFNLTNELNRLFRKSDVSEYFLRSEILEITPNMTVKSISIFRNSDYVNVGRIGLAFLRSLRLQHSHTFLGMHTINVQSIGFQIRGDEGIWGDWSEWKGCDSPADYVASRSRKCLTKDTLQPTSVDRCLLIPGKKSDFDIMPCSKYQAMLQQRELELLETLPESGSD